MEYFDLINPENSTWFGTELAMKGGFVTIYREDVQGEVVTVLIRHDAYADQVKRGLLPRPHGLCAARVCSSDEVRPFFPVRPKQKDAILLFDGQADPLVMVFSENTWVLGFRPDYKTANIREVRIVTERGMQASTQNMRAARR